MLRFLDPLQYEREILRFCVNFNLEICDTALKFRLMGITVASPSGDNSELSCHLSTSRNTQDMVSHRHETYVSSRRYLLGIAR